MPPYALVLLLAALMHCGCTQPGRPIDTHECRYPELTVVVHTSDSAEMAPVVNASLQTWLQNMKVVVVTGGNLENQIQANAVRRRKLLTIRYDNNPGCGQEHGDACGEQWTYIKTSRYLGAHRMVAGALFAYDLFKSPWILFVDDDNVVRLDEVMSSLSVLNPSIPLFLVPTIRPRELLNNCYETSHPDRWGCCSDPLQTCNAYYSAPEQSIFAWNGSTMVVESVCGDEHNHRCCRTSPWPEGFNRGFPYRADVRGEYRPHYFELYPYGGGTYILSRALIDRAGRAAWERGVLAHQCLNADIRFMQLVLTLANVSFTQFANKYGCDHHVKTAEHVLVAVKRWYPEMRDLVESMLTQL